MSTITRLPITESALMKRLNRHYGKEGLMVCKTRNGSRAAQEFGEFYLRDVSTGFVNASNIDIEDIARDEGVLAESEEIV